MDDQNRKKSEPEQDFSEYAAEARPSLVVELYEFLATTKKWWLAPIVVVLLLVGVLIMMSGTAAAPFIYPLF